MAFTHAVKQDVTHTCYLLPWSTLYYKCLAQIAEMIIEFWKSITRTINKMMIEFSIIVSHPYSALYTHNTSVLLLFWICPGPPG